MSPEVLAVSESLVLANHILAREGVLDAFGHISARHPERPDRFLLSCSRSAAQVTIGDFMVFDHLGYASEDHRTPFLERFIHGSIYEARPDVHAVLHNHSAELIPYGVTGTPLRPMIHVGGCMGEEVRTWDIRDRFGDTSMLVTCVEHARDLASVLGAATACLMRGHGAVVTGPSIRHCVLTAIYIQQNAKLDMQARLLGPVRYLTAGEIALGDETLFDDNPASRAWSYLSKRASQSTTD